MTPDTILDVGQVAEILRCEPRTVEDHMRSRALGATKIGTGWITTYGKVVEFVLKQIGEQGRPKATPVELRRTRRQGPVEIPDVRGIQA